MQFENLEQTYEFLKQLGAPPRLIRHIRKGSEAADLINIDFNKKFVC